MVFYLDVSLEETLRRHEFGPLRAEVPPERLREWYVAHDLLGVPGEVVLDAGNHDEAELLALVIEPIGRDL